MAMTVKELKDTLNKIQNENADIIFHVRIEDRGEVWAANLTLPYDGIADATYTAEDTCHVGFQLVPDYYNDYRNSDEDYTETMDFLTNALAILHNRNRDL